jgi:hypothetical protein
LCSSHQQKGVLYLKRRYIFVTSMAMQKTALGSAIAIVIAIVLTMTSVMGLLQASKTVSNTGIITAVNVGAYQDSGCTQTLSSLNWGSVNPASSVNMTIYLKNTGNTRVSLNMTVNGWNPANASSYMALTWNCEGTLLNAGNSTAALLTLSVFANVTSSGISNFGFNTTITGTQN